MKQTIICTVCPNGCAVEAEYTCKEDMKLSGYGCKRGITYCTDECFAPMRTFTSSVAVQGACRRMLPVRTDGVVPKEMLMQCAEAVKGIRLSAPVKTQQVIAADFLGTGVNLIAAMSLEKED